jgi:sigma-54 interacting transcriptional regulator
MSQPTYQFPRLSGFVPGAMVFGKTETMHVLRRRIDKVANANVPVLIQGESGTGKGIIHRTDPHGMPRFISFTGPGSAGSWALTFVIFGTSLLPARIGNEMLENRTPAESSQVLTVDPPSVKLRRKQ